MVFKKHRRGQSQADREREQRLTVSVARAVKEFYEQEAQAQAQVQAQAQAQVQAQAQAQAATAQAQVATAQATVAPVFQPQRARSSCDVVRTDSGNVKQEGERINCYSCYFGDQLEGNARARCGRCMRPLEWK